MVNPLKRGLVISRGPWPRSSFRFCYLEDSTVLSERQTGAESDEVELSKVRVCSPEYAVAMGVVPNLQAHGSTFD